MFLVKVEHVKWHQQINKKKLCGMLSRGLGFLQDWSISDQRLVVSISQKMIKALRKLKPPAAVLCCEQNLMHLMCIKVIVPT